MSVKIISNEKNVLEIELVAMDQSLAQALAERLSSESDVEFASYKLDHPILASPRIYVRTKKGDPVKLVLVKVKEMKEDVEEFKNKFSSLVEK